MNGERLVIELGSVAVRVDHVSVVWPVKQSTDGARMKPGCKEWGYNLTLVSGMSITPTYNTKAEADEERSTLIGWMRTT